MQKKEAGPVGGGTRQRLSDRKPADAKPHRETAQAAQAVDSIIIGERHRRDMGDIDSLAASIGELGLLHPVVVRPDGSLIAGARRLAAVKALGWNTVPVTVVDLNSIGKGEFAENTFRKDFTLSEAVAIKRELEPIERAAAKERMLAGKPLGNLPQGKGRAADKATKVTGKARRTLDKAEAIVVAAEAEPKRFGKLLDDMDRTGRVNGVYRRLKNAQQAAAIRAEPPPLPGNGPYRVAVVDIPWAYEPDDDNTAQRGVLPYPTMSIEQASALDVGSIMHADSVLFVWVTNFVLVRGLHVLVLDAWGFGPKTLITWPKDDSGRGHWLKGQTEHVVMAVRGKPVVESSDLSTLLRGPFHLVRKNAHSAKPIEFYGFVEKLAPAPAYADLFSRYQHNGKWDCHGDQAPAAEQQDDLAIPGFLRRTAPPPPPGD
jgi:N6-adenosine-specific RNA methylase IME4